MESGHGLRIAALTLCCLAGALSGDTPAQAAARSASDWRQIGPYYSEMRHVAVNPKNSGELYATGHFSGNIIKSSDAGRTWMPWNQGLVERQAFCRGIAVLDDKGGTLLLTSNQGIYGRTTDDTRWRIVAGEPHIDQWACVRGTEGTFYGYGPNEKTLFSSRDGGRTWSGIRKFEAAQPPTSLFFDAETNLILLGVSNWPPQLHTGKVGADGQIAWSQAAVNPEDHGLIRACATNPAFPAVWYAGTELGGKAHGNFYRSSDAGKTWIRVPLLPDDLAIQRNLQITQIVSTGQKPSRVFVATPAGLFTGRDDGATIQFDKAPRLESRRVSEIAVDAPARKVYAATDAGIWASDDLGATWRVSYEGMEPLGISKVAEGPEGSGKLLAQFQSKLYLGSPEEGWNVISDHSWAFARGGKERKTIFSGRQNSVDKTNDAGATWKAMSTDVTPWDIAWLADGLCVIGQEDKLLLSRDEGATWTNIAPPQGGRLWGSSLTMDMSDPARLYLGLRENGLMNIVGGRTKGDGHRVTAPLKACRSLDGGKTWQDVPNTNGREPWATRVVGSAAQGKALYAAADPMTTASGTPVFRSLDGGNTWEAFDNQGEIGRVSALAVSPDNPLVVYAGDRAGGVFISQDAGKTWARLGERLPMFPLNDTTFRPAINDVLVSPNGDGAIYLATDRGVFRRVGLK